MDAWWETYAHKSTINGCRMRLKIFLSEFTCSTCLSLTTSLFFKTFIAKCCTAPGWFAAGRSLTSNTRPNVPVPIVPLAASLEI
jgi:hypothetical protein